MQTTIYAIRKGQGSGALFARQPDLPTSTQVTWDPDTIDETGRVHPDVVVLSDRSLAFALAAHLGADVVEIEAVS